MKRSGQRWGRDGSQGVLSIRARCQSDRFDRVWKDLVPRLNRHGDCVPTALDNNNGALRVARAA